MYGFRLRSKNDIGYSPWSNILEYKARIMRYPYVIDGMAYMEFWSGYGKEHVFWQLSMLVF